MKNQLYDYGMIGLGTMGRNLAFNMSDHGFSVAGYDKNPDQLKFFEEEGTGKNISAIDDLQNFIQSLKTPRVIILLVPAGKIVDVVINEIKTFLEIDDLMMDCGNSHFTDTDRRIDQLQDAGIHFMGVGVSGGESGARFGPSIMPGGPQAVYSRVQLMLEAIAAKVNNTPCVAWLGTGSSGHYVKMVHNGIEYGIMQLIAETYHLLKEVGRCTDEELHKIFAKWNEGVLCSFLIEITAKIFSFKDEKSKANLIDLIVDRAKQKGTGGWTSEDAMNLQVPIPVIDSAVSMRGMSAYKEQRIQAHQILRGPGIINDTGKTELIHNLEQALMFSMLVTFAQGMDLLKTASVYYKYDLHLNKIASIWRGGCIIRASLLDEIENAYSAKPDLANLLLDETIYEKTNGSQKNIRSIIQQAVGCGIPVPALMNAVVYYDSYRSSWLPANLIQAQRDYFGAHTYERIDHPGVFHSHWNQ